jgi:hypothetical protein
MAAVNEARHVVAAKMLSIPVDHASELDLRHEWTWRGKTPENARRENRHDCHFC